MPLLTPTIAVSWPSLVNAKSHGPVGHVSIVMPGFGSGMLSVGPRIEHVGR